MLAYQHKWIKESREKCKVQRKSKTINWKSNMRKEKVSNELSELWTVSENKKFKMR